MQIRIDNRERDRIKKAQDYYIYHNVTVEQLKVGDFIFDDKVVFEFKTMRDFIGSVKDGRVFHQAQRQAETFPFHFIVLQGTQKDKGHAFDYFYYNNNPFNLKNMVGAIARLNTITTVIRVGTLNEAFLTMEAQARKCLDGRGVCKPKRNTSNVCYNMLCNIQGVGGGTAKSIVECLELRSLRDLLELDLSDLCSVKGVGVKTGRLILDSIG